MNSVIRNELGNGVRRHLPDETQVRPPVREDALSERCVSLASDLGFVRAGVTSLEPFVDGKRRLDAFLQAELHGEMSYLMPDDETGSAVRHDPRSVWPEARSILSVALPYETPHLVAVRRKEDNPHDRQAPADKAPPGYVARYARGHDYHGVIKERLLELADRIADLVGRPIQSRVCVDTAPLLERDVAVRAGFAFLGKNTLCIAPGVGSHFLLGELLLDVPLRQSRQTAIDGCGSCRKCLDACPTGAFIDAHQLDARKCISYLTIESHADFPRALRPQVGTHVFGCDICQSVCPYNAGKGPPSDSKLAPHATLEAPDLTELLNLTSSGHRKLVRGTALRRVSRDRLARNAAVALGNTGKEAAVAPLLSAALGHRSPQVRRHAAWALAHLATAFELAEAKRALLRLENEAEPEVWEEVVALSAAKDPSGA